MNKESENFRKNEVDFLVLIKPLFERKWYVVKAVTFFAILGLFVAFYSETTFVADTIFIPQVSESGASSGLSGNLGGLASLAGIEIGTGQSMDFPPALYPKLLENVSFQLKLLETPLVVKGQTDTVTYREYYLSIHRESLLSLIGKYTLGLPSILINAIKGKSDESTADLSNGFIEVSDKDKMLITDMLNQVTIDPNIKGGYVSLSFTMPDKYLAAQMASHLEGLIHKELIQYQTNKVMMELRNVESRYEERKLEFESVKQNLATFRDRNQNLNTEISRGELSQLEDEYDLSFSIYKDLARQLEETKLRVARDTPLITTIKPIVIPFKKSGPQRVLIFFVFSFAGGCFAVGKIYLIFWLKGMKEE